MPWRRWSRRPVWRCWRSSSCCCSAAGGWATRSTTSTPPAGRPWRAPGIETGSPDAAHPPQDDIRLGTCEVGPDGGVRAGGTITDHTDQPAHYRVSVAFEQGTGPTKGPEFGSTVVDVDTVEPAATVNWEASVPQRPDGLFTCRVTRIDRWVVGQAPPESLGATGGG